VDAPHRYVFMLVLTLVLLALRGVALLAVIYLSLGNVSKKHFGGASCKVHDEFQRILHSSIFDLRFVCLPFLHSWNSSCNAHDESHTKS